MFCKVHLRYCCMVYTLFFLFPQTFSQTKQEIPRTATCILLFCSLYAFSLERSFKVSLIDFISSFHWTHGPCFLLALRFEVDSIELCQQLAFCCPVRCMFLHWSVRLRFSFQEKAWPYVAFASSSFIFLFCARAIASYRSKTGFLWKQNREMKKPCQIISFTFFIEWFHCLLRCVVYDKEKYKPLGFKRAYGLYSNSLWAFFLLFCIVMFNMSWKVHLIDMFDMFCKVHLRLCFTVYLFFCFYHLGKARQDQNMMISATWSLFFVGSTLRCFIQSISGSNLLFVALFALCFFFGAFVWCFAYRNATSGKTRASKTRQDDIYFFFQCARKQNRERKQPF